MCKRAWTTKLIEDAIEEGPGSALLICKMDWFEKAIVMKKVVVPVKISGWDWFDEIAEGDDKFKNKGASSGNTSVDSFNSNIFKGTSIDRDLGITSHVWPVFSDTFERADWFSV